MKPDNTGEKLAKGQFRKGLSGNPTGRPAGTRNHATILAEQLMGADIEAIIDSIITSAKNGDMTAAKLVLERLVPVKKGRPISLNLPPVPTKDQLIHEFDAIIKAVAEGEIGPSEAQSLASVLEAKKRMFDMEDVERRVTALERATKSPK